MKRLLSQLTCSSLASVMLLANAGQAMAQQATSQATSAGRAETGGQSGANSAPPVEIAGLPDSPGATQAQSAASAPGGQTSSPSTTPPNQPSGTAAAPTVAISGNAASRPAGAAIAPPKQRQVRSLLIKMGFIAGAGAALAAVALLTLASPGKVPGSH